MSDAYLEGIHSDYSDDAHRHRWSTVELSASHFTEKGEGLYAEVQIWELPDGGLLRRTRINLLAEQTLHRLALSLEKRSPGLDWDGMLTQAAWLSVERWREGAPFELPDPTINTRRSWLLEPFLESDGLTQLFAPGSSGKGYFGISVCVALWAGLPIFGHKPTGTGPSFYLDYEASKIEFDKRVARVLAGLELGGRPEIYYRREYAPLESTVEHVASMVRQKQGRLVVVDSKGMAVAGAPEKSEPALGLLRAMRRFPCPVLLIDHMSDAGMKENSNKAYGSIYMYNEARLVWKIRSDVKTDEIRMLLTNPKANNGPRSRPISLDFKFNGTAVHISRGDNLVLASSAGEGATIADKISEYLLEDGPAPSKVIAAAIDVTRDSVRKTLSRGESTRFFRVGGADLWKLADPTLIDPM